MTLPMHGVRILDFGHVVTGPFATGLLADFGADVIKVESATAVEGGRRLGPFRPAGPREPEGSAIFAGLNRNKRSVTINLKHPQGRDVAAALARRCDVVAENFSVGVMARLGLGPDDLRAADPRLIYVSMSGLGSGGPRSGWVSFNIVIQALSGLMRVTGRPDDAPIGVSNSWADFVAGLHAALVIIAALEERDRNGGGRWIDLSQYELNALPLGHLMLAAQRGDGAGRAGNRSDERIPQGCYACLEDDTWCVISIGDDAEWQALVRTVGEQRLAEARYRTREGRRAAADEIDRLLDAWTRQRRAREIERMLQAAGVTAVAVRTSTDVLEELPALAPGFRVVEHAAIGEIPLLPNPIHIDGLPARFDHAGPRLGEHTDEVLREVLELSDAEIAELRRAGALK